MTGPILFGATGDWHIGPMGGRIGEGGHNARMLDLYRCARFVVEEARRRGAVCLLHAGDFSDTWRPTPTTVDFLRTIFRAAGEMPILGIDGNHDQAGSEIEMPATSLFEQEEARLTIVREPMVMGLFEGLGKDPSPRFVFKPIDDALPEGWERLHLQIACVPWPNRQRLLASEETRGRTPEQINLLIREKMMEIIHGLAVRVCETAKSTAPAVLLLHCTVDESFSGGYSMMMTKDWRLNAHELMELPFDYVALGHIHKQQGWGRDPTDDSPARMVAYCGSPEVVSFKEEGEAKGFYLVTVGGGEPTRYEFVETPYRRFVTIDTTADEFTGLDQVVAQAKDAIVRLRLPATQAGQARDLVQMLEKAGAHEVRVEIVRAETTRRREIDLGAGDMVEAGIDAWLAHHEEWKPRRDEMLVEAHRIEERRREIAA